MTDANTPPGDALSESEIAEIEAQMGAQDATFWFWYDNPNDSDVTELFKRFTAEILRLRGEVARAKDELLDCWTDAEISL